MKILNISFVLPDYVDDEDISTIESLIQDYQRIVLTDKKYYEIRRHRYTFESNLKGVDFAFNGYTKRGICRCLNLLTCYLNLIFETGEFHNWLDHRKINHIQ